jgi:hypothetical protein
VGQHLSLISLFAILLGEYLKTASSNDRCFSPNQGRLKRCYSGETLEVLPASIPLVVFEWNPSNIQRLPVQQVDNANRSHQGKLAATLLIGQDST